MLEHGGKLRAAAAQWGIPLADWLDLSTGVAPDAYPVPPIATASWRRLPEDDDGLVAVAAAYYGSDALLPLPGSQAAIMALPRLRPPGTAAVLAPSYGEYAAAWQAAGHRLRSFAADELEAVAASCDTVMLGNPNNPTGERFASERLLAAARRLQARGGWLIVDEAFADADGGAALAALAGGAAAPNLIVLRSLGKFFGLAGARVGFAVAAPAVLAPLAELIGPWPIAHPARDAARAALADAAWQSAQRARLHAASDRLAQMLSAHGWGVTAGTALYRYLATPRAAEIFAALAGRGILIRRFDAPSGLRIGLPGTEAEWARLDAALSAIEVLP
ncbi:MAG: threonine-phosphate decarboxylase [Rhodocyclales bacterium]|nr:threonine-phosphate decarboxylase [Rhodocyclales bacterium]